MQPQQLPITVQRWCVQIKTLEWTPGQTKDVHTSVTFVVAVPLHRCYHNIHTTLQQSLYSCVPSDWGCVWRRGLVPWSMLWQVFRSSRAMFIFWMSSRLLYYCFIHRACTNYFSSSLHRGVDWQLPSLEWSVCYLDLAEAIWCILTIIGATATIMFSKSLCYFPGGCLWGIFWVAAWSAETLSESGQMGGQQIRDTTI